MKNILLTKEEKEFSMPWIHLIVGILSIIFVVWVVITFLVPAVMGMLNSFLLLVEMLKLLEMPYLFFGSLAFLFISFYVFNAVTIILIRIVEWAFEEINKYTTYNRRKGSYKK